MITVMCGLKKQVTNNILQITPCFFLSVCMYVCVHNTYTSGSKEVWIWWLTLKIRLFLVSYFPYVFPRGGGLQCWKG